MLKDLFEVMTVRKVVCPVLDGKIHQTEPRKDAYCSIYDWSDDERRNRWIEFMNSGAGWRLYDEEDIDKNVLAIDKEKQCYVVRMQR